ARLNTNGSLDASFGNGGWCSVAVSPNLQIPYVVALQSTGMVLVAGMTWGNASMSSSAVLARFNTRGVLDSGTRGFGTIVTGTKTAGYTMSAFGGQKVEFQGLAIQ